MTRASGQATVEYVGIVLLAALALGALASVPAPPAPAEAILRAMGIPAKAGESELAVVDRYMDADLDDFLAYRASPARDRRLDWSTDQCSAPVVGSTGSSFDFTEACLRHDFGYRNYRRLGVFEERKAMVDERFLADMRAHCATRARDEVERCLAWARLFYLAVHHLAAARQPPRTPGGAGMRHPASSPARVPVARFTGCVLGWHAPALASRTRGLSDSRLGSLR